MKRETKRKESVQIGAKIDIGVERDAKLPDIER